MTSLYFLSAIRGENIAHFCSIRNFWSSLRSKSKSIRRKKNSLSIAIFLYCHHEKLSAVVGAEHWISAVQQQNEKNEFLWLKLKRQLIRRAFEIDNVVRDCPATNHRGTKDDKNIINHALTNRPYLQLNTRVG